MNETTKKIFNCGIVPVIKLEDASDAKDLCSALLEGGINVAEVTFRTAAAADAIKNISSALPDVFVGAGTVLTVEQAEKAVSSGAGFIVTPGFNKAVVEYCLKNNVPVYPGISSPTDIETGLSYGLDTLKFFPAEASGGVKALKAMSAPYSMLKFMPTGGIDASNITDYLSLSCVIACGGSWMVKEDLIKDKKFNEITKISKEAVNKMHNFKFAHMAINNDSKETALSLMNLFSSAFGLAPKEGNSSAFSGSEIELLYSEGPGEKGHIGFKTTNAARALAYFERIGIEINRESIRGTADNPTFFYLKQSIGGFAVHVMS